MTFLRAIRDDLVEKKLWPVAVALLVALVAVPFLLGRGGEDLPAAAPLPDPSVTATPVTGTAKQPLVLAEASTNDRRPTGRFKDPFKHADGAGDGTTAAPADNTAVTVQPVDDVSAGSGAGGSTVTGDAPSVSSVSPPAASDPAGDSGSGSVSPSSPVRSAPQAGEYAAGYRVDLDWGPAADPESLSDVTRLKALEARGTPEVVFMGVRPDGKTALFLLVGEAEGSGDARCRPTTDLCHLLEMRAGDTQFLDVITDDGVRQFELHVRRVSERDAGTPAAADERLERFSKAGRALVKDTIEGGRTFVRRFVYASQRGVLVFVEADETKAATRGVLEPAE